MKKFFNELLEYFCGLSILIIIITIAGIVIAGLILWYSELQSGIDQNYLKVFVYLTILSVLSVLGLICFKNQNIKTFLGNYFL